MLLQTKPSYSGLVHFIWNQCKIREFSTRLYGTLNGSIFTFSTSSDLKFCTHSRSCSVHFLMWFWGLKVKICKIMTSHFATLFLFHSRNTRIDRRFCPLITLMWLCQHYVKLRWCCSSTGGWTYTDRALHLARNDLFKPGNGVRAGVTKVSGKKPRSVLFSLSDSQLLQTYRCLKTSPVHSFVCLFLRSFVCALRSYVCALRSFVCALRSFVCALRSFVCALRSFVRALRSFVCALRSFVCALRPFVCALCSFVCALRSFVCTLRSFVCALRSFVCALRSFVFELVLFVICLFFYLFI